MYCVSGWLTILEAEHLVLRQRPAAPGVGVARAVLERLGRHLGERRRADPVLGHVALDLHGEELRREHESGLAVPGAEPPVLRQRVERARRVLVEADDERDLGGAGREHRVRRRERRPAGRAAVVDVDERHAGEAEHRDGRVGVARRVGSAGGEARRPASRRRRRAARRGPRPPPSPGPTPPRAARTGGCPRRRPRPRWRSLPLRRPEGIRQRAGGAGRRDQHELHRHPDAQARRVGLGQPRLDTQLALRARRSRRRTARSRRPRRRTAATWAGSTGSSTSTASRGGRAGAPGRRSTCTPRTSPGAGRRRPRSGGTRTRSARARPAARRAVRPRPGRSQPASTRAGSKAIAGERATM